MQTNNKENKPKKPYARVEQQLLNIAAGSTLFTESTTLWYCYDYDIYGYGTFPPGWEYCYPFAATSSDSPWQSAGICPGFDPVACEYYSDTGDEDLSIPC